MSARDLAIEAFYSESHPLLDKYLAEKGVDADREGYGVDLAELIAFAEALPKRQRKHLANYQETRDRLVGNLMDRWHQSHASARELLEDECPELVAALDALYAHGDTGKH